MAGEGAVGAAASEPDCDRVRIFTQLAGHFGLNPASIAVVNEAPDPVFQLCPGMAREPIALYIGGFGPHKNVSALVRAFAGLVNGHPSARLVLVGENRKEVFHSEIGKIEGLVGTVGIRSRVAFTGFLPDSEVVTWLNRSWVLALPSVMEGYGLAAVEGAACGCPVVATRNSPLPQVLEGGGLFIDPEEPVSLEAALRTMFESPGLRDQLAEGALRASSRLTWTAAAATLESVMESA